MSRCTMISSELTRFDSILTQFTRLLDACTTTRSPGLPGQSNSTSADPSDSTTTVECNAASCATAGWSITRVSTPTLELNPSFTTSRKWRIDGPPPAPAVNDGVAVVAPVNVTEGPLNCDQL